MKSLGIGLIALLMSFGSLAQDQMYEICPLLTGEEVLDSLFVVNTDGESIRLDEVTTNKTVLIFYRGGWCPYCTRHLSALQKVKDEILELGYDIVAITPDQFDSLAVSEAHSSSDFSLYSDSDADVIEAFGLGWKIDDTNYIKYRDSYGMDSEVWSGEEHHILPVPAVYVVNEGVVEFSYVNPNYWVRLKAEALLAILQSL